MLFYGEGFQLTFGHLLITAVSVKVRSSVAIVRIFN